MKYLSIAVNLLVFALLVYMFVPGASVPLWLRLAIFVHLLVLTVRAGIGWYREARKEES